jgi:glyceraldehyde-3-phosphate dehydrogenase/erythrose-4-phosphate dehydrogenase
MAVRVAINGFGRIGRNILRAIVESGRTDIQVVAAHDLGPVETNAHLLRYDSVHGRFPHEVTVNGDTITTGNLVEVKSPVRGLVLRVMQESETVVNAGMAILELRELTAT